MSTPLNYAAALLAMVLTGCGATYAGAVVATSTSTASLAALARWESYGIQSSYPPGVREVADTIRLSIAHDAYGGVSIHVGDAEVAEVRVYVLDNEHRADIEQLAASVATDRVTVTTHVVPYSLEDLELLARTRVAGLAGLTGVSQTWVDTERNRAIVALTRTPSLKDRELLAAAFGDAVAVISKAVPYAAPVQAW